MPTKVLVLGGGPDAEREVSINSATAIASALKADATFEPELKIIDRLTPDQLRAMKADVIFPYLHGPYGEGGPLQDVLEADGRPFVGSGALASRLAMDKVATKQAALMLRVATPPMFMLNPADTKAPFNYPVVIKPVHEGSTVGLHIVTDQPAWERAITTIRAEATKGVVRTYMVEPKVGGTSWARELTVGVLDNSPLPIVEIKPKGGLYDYEAKYVSNDTKYVVDPELPPGIADAIKRDAVNLCRALQCRHIARVDFMLGADNRVWMLEVNTTPGMTDHSLVPKAALKLGMTMPALCRRLVELALRDAQPKTPNA